MAEILQIYGMARSGHHAVIEWIAAHYSGMVTHYNNCQLSPIPSFTQCPPPFPDLYYKNTGGELILSSGQGKDCNIYSFEDTLQVYYEDSKKVLCIRDPYNLFASRTHKQRNFKNRWPIYYAEILLWKAYAREFIGQTSILGKNVTKINYNSWFSNLNYRKEISSNFGIHTDKSLNHVPTYYNGSSFDVLEFQNRAQNMDVLNRWLNYKNDLEFIRKVMDDEELRELSTIIFGKITE